jgi:hypothetical protein
MNGFCPDGYVPAQEAIPRAVERWFPEQFNQFVVAMESQPASRPEGHIEQAVQAFSPPQIPGVSRDAWENIVSQTVHRLRNILHQGKLNAYYFDEYGSHIVRRDSWVTTETNGVLESGTYWPFGKPSRVYERQPNYRLFLRQTKLDKLLSEESSKKRSLPKSKMSELVAALRELDHHPNRRAQYEALCDLPEFREYRITDSIFREAARHVPREAGRKSRRES